MNIAARPEPDVEAPTNLGASVYLPRAVPLTFLVLAILAQIWWPLASGDGRVVTTLAVVALFSATSITHAWSRYGASWAAAYAVTATAVGFGVEYVGVHTGWPFTEYAYSDVLQPQLAGIPIVVPLAWTMMTWPALLVGRTLIPSPARASRPTRLLAWAAIGTWALASWDLFLDPQMVAEGYWTWADPDPHLPGVPGIPVANYAGWLLASLVLISVLIALARLMLRPEPPTPSADAARRPATDTVRGRREDDALLPGRLRWPVDAAVIVAYLWTWLGGVVANAVFLGRPWVGLVGGIGMGIVGVPLLLSLRSR